MKCSAHLSHAPFAPCKNWAVKGARVCRNHGGSAPHVKANARARLDSFVEPALARLRKLVDSADSDGVKLAAVRDILDRTGYKLPERIESDNATTIRVEYETVEVLESSPMTAPTTTSGSKTEQTLHGSYTNGTSKHED
jgi:hypothetical protein